MENLTMNKKRYQNPAIKVYATEMTSLICASGGGIVTSISSSSSTGSDFTLGGDGENDEDAR